MYLGSQYDEFMMDIFMFPNMFPKICSKYPGYEKIVSIKYKHLFDSWIPTKIDIMYLICLHNVLRKKKIDEFVLMINYFAKCEKDPFFGKLSGFGKKCQYNIVSREKFYRNPDILKFFAICGNVDMVNFLFNKLKIDKNTSEVLKMGIEQISSSYCNFAWKYERVFEVLRKQIETILLISYYCSDSDSENGKQLLFENYEKIVSKITENAKICHIEKIIKNYGDRIKIFSSVCSECITQMQLLICKKSLYIILNYLFLICCLCDNKIIPDVSKRVAHKFIESFVTKM